MFGNRSINDLGTEYDLYYEFEEHKALHKYSVLMAKMINYYETIMADEIKIPEFLTDDTAEKRAKDSIKELYNRDKQEFNRLYEEAWEEIADIMP